MKKILQNIGNYIHRQNSLVAILYVILILSAHLIMSNDFSIPYFVIYFIRITLLSLLICPFLIRFLSNKKIINDKTNATFLKNTWLRKCIFFMIPFSLFLIYYFAYYPGGFSVGAISQLGQALENNYNDWHPVMHTLFAFKLPLVLSGGWIGSIVLFQIICFSLVLAYSFEIIFQYTNIKYTCFSILFVILNPQLGGIAMYPWKDVSFSIGSLLLLSYALQTYMTKGKWIQKWQNAILFSIVWVITTLFRHNAILFTIPLMFAIIFWVNKKKLLVIGLSVSILMIGIKVPLYSVLNVEKPDQRQVETLGLPINIIGGVIKYQPEKVDEEIREFAYKVAPKEVWERDYVLGDYNSIKKSEKTNNFVIEEYGRAKVIKMMLQCFKNAPLSSLQAFITLTKATYTITMWCNRYMRPGIYNKGVSSLDPNKYGLVSQHNVILSNICEKYNRFVSLTFYEVFMSLGVIHLFLILSILSKCKWNKFNDWKKIFFVLPVFCYNFGTTLLLTSMGDSTRFFCYTFFVIPLLLVFLYRKDEIHKYSD